MSVFKLYTEEQEAKIARLREEANKPKTVGIDMSRYKTEFDWFRPIKATDRVTVTLEGITIIGYVLSVSTQLVPYTKSSDRFEEFYNISTPQGVMKNVPKSNVHLRYYKDLSHVVIPEELKKETIRTLLNEINNRRTSNDDYVSRFGKYSYDEIKAELRTRPNIKRNKRTKHVISKYSK